MSKLSKEDLEALRRLREFSERVENVPEEERVPVTNPRMTEDLAVGMDDKGESFPVHDASGQVLSDEQARRRIAARDRLDPAEIEQLKQWSTGEKMRGLVETIDGLRRKQNRTDAEDELLAEFEAYYEALAGH